MWQELLSCMSAREVALCIPWQGTAVPLVYWYGVLASVGIFVGALYASKHVEMEGENPDIIWDMLLWIIIPALLGARLWYVAQANIGAISAGRPAPFSLSQPLYLLNPRTGGMNIFGGAIGGLIALILYVRAKKVDGWLLADASLIGLLVGQGIGRIGNFINIELYGPPTNSNWFGMIVPMDNRINEFSNPTLYPPTMRFHPTMIYEMLWLFLTFGVLVYLFRRYQERFVHGVLAGIYLVLAGIGRFVIETWRPDQPAPPDLPWLSYSRMISLLYIVVGLIIALDRMNYLRIPFISRPETAREREKSFQEIQLKIRRRERAKEREAQRAQRLRERNERRKAKNSEPVLAAAEDEE